MFTNEDLYELAIKKIDIIANEPDEFPAILRLSSLITGRFMQDLRSEPNGPHHYDLVVRVLNDYFKENPDSKMDSLFEKALDEASGNSTSLYAVSNLVDTMICQLDMEKIGKASIKLNSQQAIVNITRIKQRAEEFYSNNEISEKEYQDVVNYLSKANAYLQKHHGISFQ